jgi:hypothetical protein
VLWLRNANGFYVATSPDFANESMAKSFAESIARGYRATSRTIGGVIRWFAEIYEKPSIPNGIGKWVAGEKAHLHKNDALNVGRREIYRRRMLADAVSFQLQGDPA